MRLDGKVALITGGGSGMGKVAAELFATEGARDVLTDVNDEAGEATATGIGEAARYVHADVSVEADVERMVAETVAAFGRLAELRRDWLVDHPAADWLSAGMSGDLEAAIAVGATHVRVGTSVLGSRPSVQ